MAVNQLILGDNLEIMRKMDSESVDLIYLDPPFFSNRNYEVIWGDEGEICSFTDRWAGGIDHYIGWLYERVEEMKRLLKPTGSIFLHCDWHANAEIKVDILSKLFGRNNFRNEIIWKRTNAKGNITQRFGINTDTILFYSKSSEFKFNLLRGNYSVEQLSRYKQEDDNGVYRCENLTAPGTSRQFVWRGVHPGKSRSWSLSEEKLEELYQQGLILQQKDGRPRKDGLKKYLADAEGMLLGNIWDDVERIANTSKERIGYPTQKPEALLKRIIQCASNEGDVVLDPFVGGGTTVAVADKLKRQWIGIDQSVAAVKVTDLRLRKQQDMYSQPYELKLRKYDYDTLRNQDAFAFESWIIEQFGGAPNTKQRNDMGLDGKAADGAPIQVKRSDNIGREVLDKFLSAVQRSNERLFEKNKTEGKPVGYIIAFSFSKGAVAEAARLKTKKGITIELKKVSDIVPYSNAPKVNLTAEEIDTYKYLMQAKADGEADIEFYSWDFDHKEGEGFKADVMLDKEGKQTRKFAPGEHQIAVEAVNKQGLEGAGKMKLNVNDKG
jgi:DNA modification methylase